MKHMLTFVVSLAILLSVDPAWGELSKQDRKQVKKMLSGTLYMRMDAPCATGRHPYGVYKRPLVEVSPAGADTDTGTLLTASWWHADSTYWGIRVNDPVKLDEFDYDDDDAEIEIELEGVGPADDNSTVLKLVDIHSIDDFKAAFDKTFATVPLQDEHEDWSAEIKEAVGDRRLVNGMSKRQVYYITGNPKNFEKKEESGKQVEIWHLRQDKGMKMGYFTAKAGESSGLPASIRFEDGKLVEAVESGTSDNFNLDN